MECKKNVSIGVEGDAINIRVAYLLIRWRLLGPGEAVVGGAKNAILLGAEPEVLGHRITAEGKYATAFGRGGGGASLGMLPHSGNPTHAAWAPRTRTPPATACVFHTQPVPH